MRAVVYSRVIQLLRSVKIDYVEYKYDLDFTKHEFQEEFGSDATFPQVSIGTRYIGGCKETLKWLQKENLI